MKFSANLGFLWSDRPLPEAIRSAKAAGFDAVECHWPYDVPAEEMRAALIETGLRMLGLNTRRGNVAAGENGLSALPGREAEARAAIDEAIEYATAVEAAAVHVMAGYSGGPRARQAFVSNLTYACDTAAERGIVILIEPLNHYNAPGYYLNSVAQAADIVREVGKSNLRIMFDFYHIQILEGDVTRRLEAVLPLVGHIQVASVPDRGAPDHGELDYAYVFERLEQIGWDAPIGAEYLTASGSPPDLAWLVRRRSLA
ncbi:hydroxypyruvate isomerase [Rhizobium sp. SLBN-94]|nr:hydroxypyruvate isomerase [Rhizobium sp. SLBN-94]